MSEWCPVACEYRLMNRCIADTTYILATYINLHSMRANSARRFLSSALPQGWVSICQKDNQYDQIIMLTIIDVSWCWLDNELHWGSTEHQQSVNGCWACQFGNWSVIWSLLCISDTFADFIGKRDRNMVTAPFWEWTSMKCQQFLALHLG